MSEKFETIINEPVKTDLDYAAARFPGGIAEKPRATRGRVRQPSRTKTRRLRLINTDYAGPVDLVESGSRIARVNNKRVQLPPPHLHTLRADRDLRLSLNNTIVASRPRKIGTKRNNS